MSDRAALEALGWNDFFENAFRALDDEKLIPARIGVEHRNRYLVNDGASEIDARLTGRLRMHMQRTGDRPVVGDWVAISMHGDGTAALHERLPRKSQFSRKAAGRTAQEQVMAANVDVVFLASALTADLNPRRLERYLLMAWESGAKPVIVLTKADLAQDIAALRAEIEGVAQGAPIHSISSTTGLGLEELTQYLQPGTTIAVLGSSGVGKSTLINRLMGIERFRTGEVRDDGRGRHTTTYRELVRLPGGALIIDTPGLRELQLWEADTGLQEAFTDIDELAAQCRFADCAHSLEPDCAVIAAVRAGQLSPERLDSYKRLSRELDHVGEQLDARARSLRNRANRVADKMLKKRLKEKDQ